MASATNLSQLESTIGGWYKTVPHLPKNGQKWLAENIWWLALIGAVISVIGLLIVIPLFFAALAVTAAVSSVSLMYSPVATGLGGLSWLSILLSIVSYIVTTVLLVMAISPLKVHKKRGWNLLFWSYLASFVLSVVGEVATLNFFSIISSVIGAAISGYFLYEIRSYFVAKAHTVHHAKAAAK